MDGGGLCLFFVNETRLVAPYPEERLINAGTEDHAALFTGFTAENGFDVNDLPPFAITHIEEMTM